MFIVSLATSLALLTTSLSRDVGEKIWKNECGGMVSNLTHWGQGEEFASFGIGHFIWYTKNKKGPFEESFPALLGFLEKHGESLPIWLKASSACPWNSREEFQAQLSTPKMKELREFLFKTRHLQAQFISERLEKTLPHLTADLSPQEKERVIANFNKLSQSPQGLYALIDYLNFKGSGTSASESYQGHRWGLLQVLLSIDSSEDEVRAFVEAAKKILTERVRLSPPERDEKKWLPGWINRINTYLEK